MHTRRIEDYLVILFGDTRVKGCSPFGLLVDQKSIKNKNQNVSDAIIIVDIHCNGNRKMNSGKKNICKKTSCKR